MITCADVFACSRSEMGMLCSRYLVSLEKPEGESEASCMTPGILCYVLSVQHHVCITLQFEPRFAMT